MSFSTLFSHMAIPILKSRCSVTFETGENEGQMEEKESTSMKMFLVVNWGTKIIMSNNTLINFCPGDSKICI